MRIDTTLPEFFSSLAKSFYSEEPYLDAWRRPRRAFLILLAVVALLFLPGYIRLALFVHTVKQEYVDTTVNKLPVMEVINGQVTSPVSQPYEIYVDGELLFVLDTTGEVGSLQESGAWAFMGPDQFVMYENEKGAEIRTFDFSTVDYLMFDPMRTRRWVDLLHPFVYPFMFIFTLAGLYAYRLVQGLLLSVLVLLLLRARRIGVGYDQLLAVVIQALIPSMAVETLLNLLHIYFPGRGWMLSLLIAGYVWWAIRSSLGSDSSTAAGEGDA